MARSVVSPFGSFGLIAMAITGATLGVSIALGLHPALGFLAGLNLATFVMYGVDKSAAVHDRMRVPEDLLHLLALVGGTPAAFLGQVVFRHKTRKRPFQVKFWMIAVLQIVLIGTAFVWRARPPAWLPEGVRSLIMGR
ncbi:MAG TPA: DUF1294 domain-containing protein [Planctomycetota bacterium]|nr:DUF1294 domain-containing protein [Planctomycetota bacterium]